MRVAAVELTHLDLPFTPGSDRHLRYWIPQWRIIQLCKVTLDNGVVGWGETIPHATHATVPTDIDDRIRGQEAAALLWRDELGAGVQQALFDAVGKTENVPVCDLLGVRHRDWCPISWWAVDMPPADWAAQCGRAVAGGYMSAKFKARPWQDLRACLEAGSRVVPPQFRFDLDFNGHLVNAASAIPLLKSLEQFEHVAMIETPIPQGDLAGNAQIRARLNRPLAMHFGEPPITSVLHDDVTDGLIIGGGAAQVLEQSALAEVANKPFWLQLVGTGITTTWAAHLGAVCRQARWPAITCMNSYESQLLRRPIEVQGGSYQVPTTPGLGIDIDEAAARKYETEAPHVDADRHGDRHVYRYNRACGVSVHVAARNRSVFHGRYTAAALPICEPGSTLDIIDDDGSREFDQLWEEAGDNGILLDRSDVNGPANTQANES